MLQYKVQMDFDMYMTNRVLEELYLCGNQDT